MAVNNKGTKEYSSIQKDSTVKDTNDVFVRVGGGRHVSSSPSLTDGQFYPLRISDDGKLMVEVLTDTELTQKIAHVPGTTQQEYVGYAHPETSPGAADAVWRIKKITYDGTKVTDVRWAKSAGGATDHLDFNKIWNDRATYTYE